MKKLFLIIVFIMLHQTYAYAENITSTTSDSDNNTSSSIIISNKEEDTVSSSFTISKENNNYEKNAIEEVTKDSESSSSINSKESNAYEKNVIEEVTKDSESELNKLSELDNKIEIDGYLYTKVSNQVEFLNAVKLNQNVVLTDDITLSGNINLDMPNDFRLRGRIKGSDKLNTLTDNTTGTETGGMFVEISRKNVNLYFEDINLIGNNYYGIVTYRNLATGTFYLNNVNFSSNNSQPFWMPSATAYITNSTFNQTNGGSNAQEFGEMKQLIIGGNTVINHDSFGGVNTNVFMWTHYGNDSDESFIKILPNSIVNLTTTKSLLYDSNFSSFKLDVGSGATFNLNLKGNFSTTPDSGKPFSYLFGENSKVKITDTSVNSDTVQTRFLPIRNGGNLTLNKNSDVEIIGNKNTVIENTFSNKINIPSDIARFKVTNKKSNKNIFNLTNSVNSGIQTNGNVINQYDVSGNKIAEYVNDFGFASFYSNTALVRNSNNDFTINSFSKNYETTRTIEYLKGRDLDLKVKQISVSDREIVGSSELGSTVWISGTYYDGTELNTYVTIDNLGNFKLNIDKALKYNSELYVYTSIGGKQFTPITEKKIIISDNNAPTADIKFSTINIKDLESFDYNSIFMNIKDDSYLQTTIEVIEPFKKEVGYSEAIIDLVDIAGNRTRYIGKSFIIDENSLIIENGEDSYLIPNKKFTRESYEIVGNIENYIKNIPYKLLDMNGKDLKGLEKFVSTDLYEIPTKGSYYSKLSIYGKEFNLEIDINESISLVNIDIPTTLLFGTSYFLNNNIISPEYIVKNNSPFGVNISLTSLDILEASNLNLTSEITNPNDLILNLNTSSKTIDLNKISNTKVFDLNSSEEEKFNLSGFYGGDYYNEYLPKYKLKFNIDRRN